MIERLAAELDFEADLGSLAPTYQVLLSNICFHDLVPLMYKSTGSHRWALQFTSKHTSCIAGVGV